MKTILSLTLLLLTSSGLLAQKAAKKADTPKKAAAKAAMAAKPAGPQMTSVMPRALHLGGEQVFTATGKELAGATLLTSHAELKPVIDTAASTVTKIVFTLKTPANLGRNAFEVWAKTAAGETAKLKLHADDIAPATSTAADFKKRPGEGGEAASEPLGHLVRNRPA